MGLCFQNLKKGGAKVFYKHTKALNGTQSKNSSKRHQESHLNGNQRNTKAKKYIYIYNKNNRRIHLSLPIVHYFFMLVLQIHRMDFSKSNDSEM